MERNEYRSAQKLESGEEIAVSEGKVIQSHFELRVHQRAEELAMEIFEQSKSFPKEERYSLTDQVRRSSRSVAVTLAEGWRRRRYPAAFVNKLNEAGAEAAETQSWIRFAFRCEYLDARTSQELISGYESVLRTLVGMGQHHESWTGRVGYNSPKPPSNQ